MSTCYVVIDRRTGLNLCHAEAESLPYRAKRDAQLFADELNNWDALRPYVVQEQDTRDSRAIFLMVPTDRAN